MKSSVTTERVLPAYLQVPQMFHPHFTAHAYRHGTKTNAFKSTPTYAWNITGWFETKLIYQMLYAYQFLFLLKTVNWVMKWVDSALIIGPSMWQNHLKSTDSNLHFFAIQVCFCLIHLQPQWTVNCILPYFLKMVKNVEEVISYHLVIWWASDLVDIYYFVLCIQHFCFIDIIEV